MTTYSHCAAVVGGPALSQALSQPVFVQPESPVANSLHSAAASPHAAWQQAPQWERDRHPAALGASLLQHYRSGIEI